MGPQPIGLVSSREKYETLGKRPCEDIVRGGPL